jgi:hypothetical protein
MGDGMKRFRTTLALNKGRARLALPFDPVVEWGARERYDVTGTVGGVTVRGPLQHEGDAWQLVLGPAWLRDAGLDATQELEVELALEGPQRGTLAADVQAALDAEPRALAFFEGLPTFYRKNYVRWIEEAKRPETRAARIAQMVALLVEGRRER